jgi:hypothetical protein
MFWLLLLAHFLADYPLQTSWMAANKGRMPVLMLHASVHFIVMLLVTAPAWRKLWLILLLLAMIHFGIDLGKITLSNYRPHWVALPYLIDQLLHYLCLGATAWWITQKEGALTLSMDPRLAIIITGYLLVTYVSAISEKVLTTSQPEYRQELASGFWPRMAFRALLLTGLLGLQFPGLEGHERAGLGAALPYVSGRYARWALLTDLLVVAGVWLFIFGAYWQLSGRI